MRLDSTAVAAGTRLIIRDAIGSTNAEALRLARLGHRGPLWVVARCQTAGRGRRGRNWVSQPGNLFASLLLTDPAPPDRAPELSFVAALALHDAVCGLAPTFSTRVVLKWPNDLLIDREKFAGILIEGEGPAVVIGIGVNCRHHPTETEFPATDLAAAGIHASPEAVLEPLSAAMVRRLAQWDRGSGIATIRNDWLARAGGRGGPVRVLLGEECITGTFETIDHDGRLIVRAADGALRFITAGDVFFPAR